MDKDNGDAQAEEQSRQREQAATPSSDQQVMTVHQQQAQGGNQDGGSDWLSRQQLEGDLPPPRGQSQQQQQYRSIEQQPKRLRLLNTPSHFPLELLTGPVEARQGQRSRTEANPYRNEDEGDTAGAAPDRERRREGKEKGVGVEGPLLLLLCCIMSSNHPLLAPCRLLPNMVVLYTLFKDPSVPSNVYNLQTTAVFFLLLISFIIFHISQN